MAKKGDSELILPDDDKELPEGIKEIAENLDEDEIQKLVFEYLEMHSGPLPHPRTLEQYKDVLPDSPERIMKMAEKEQRHRHSVQKKMVDGDELRATRGLTFGTVLLAGMIGGGIYLLAIGINIAGYVLVGSAVASGIANVIRVGRERAQIPEKTDTPEKEQKQ